MRKRTAGSFPFVFFCAVAFCPPLWYGEAEENTEKGRDILGKTTELGFLYRGKYKDCINDWFDCQRGRRDIQVSVGWSVLLSPATTLFPL